MTKGRQGVVVAIRGGHKILWHPRLSFKFCNFKQKQLDLPACPVYEYPRHRNEARRNLKKPMKTQYQFPTGTVSRATMQPFDVALAIHTEIDFANTYQDAGIEIPEPFDGFDGFDCDDEFWQSADASEYLETLFNLMENHAPPYCYFGAHPGDGADYGFWPCMDTIEDLPSFSDLAGVPADIDEDFCVVNGHGNLSVYSSVESPAILEIV